MIFCLPVFGYPGIRANGEGHEAAWFIVTPAGRPRTLAVAAPLSSVCGTMVWRLGTLISNTIDRQPVQPDGQRFWHIQKDTQTVPWKGSTVG